MKQKLFDNLKYVDNEKATNQAISKMIPDKVIDQNVEKYLDYPITPGICSYRPPAVIPTTFGTDKRFRPETLQYTKHATKLSLLDWEKERFINPRVLDFK